MTDAISLHLAGFLKRNPAWCIRLPGGMENIRSSHFVAECCFPAWRRVGFSTNARSRSESLFETAKALQCTKADPADIIADLRFTFSELWDWGFGDYSRAAAPKEGLTPGYTKSANCPNPHFLTAATSYRGMVRL